jgi:hypothetical protein
MAPPPVVLVCPDCGGQQAMSEPTYRSWTAEIAPFPLRCGLCPAEPPLQLVTPLFQLLPA